ncbi:helix-turn-helix domain-containing protein [Nocardioides carbamazepini]|uniref:helix-turn-helix domain-containing protein n=1 Tax=Nocardioides carbamazepini TaxID=2854259 RepID=UPI00214A5D1E|nr:helix-turn-helix domain-containing protein [Nocardioides carbamazepini]MCR1783878.1 helix-turn-helix domain-containing protein [Nocardioides carbamazepini]
MAVSDAFPHTDAPSLAVSASLRDLVHALRLITDVRLLGRVDPELPLRTHVLVDAASLDTEPTPEEVGVGLLVLTGDGPGAIDLLAAGLAVRSAGAILLRDPGVPVPDALLEGAVVVVPRGPEWSALLAEALRVVVEPRRHDLGSSRFTRALAEHTDLFDIAKALGVATGTLISIEDERARVMAFSPYSDQADPIRRLAILGREPPQWHVEQLRSERVYDRLRVPGKVVELPEAGEVRRRLGIGMADPTTGVYLGTIWAQETDVAFGPELEDHLLGAARYAARLVSQARQIHSVSTELVQRLLAPEGPAPGDDMPQLRVREPASFALIGLEAVDEGLAAEWLVSSEAVALLSMRAVSLGEQAMVAPYGGRLYVLAPGPSEAARDVAWAERTVAHLQVQRHATFRAAVSSSASAGSVRAARAEIERVCARTAPSAARPVVTLESDRTAVLLAECLDALPRASLLDDERFRSLVGYDARSSIDLLDTARVWLRFHGEYSTAAQALTTHQNTVRYRIGRLESVAGYDLSDPDDRLLLALQLRLHDQQD